MVGCVVITTPTRYFMTIRGGGLIVLRSSTPGPYFSPPNVRQSSPLSCTTPPILRPHQTNQTPTTIRPIPRPTTQTHYPHTQTILHHYSTPHTQTNQTPTTIRPIPRPQPDHSPQSAHYSAQSAPIAP
ncbi:gp27 [Brochothrix phage A9]|uniref:Gp27 n=1 Tax=Brochothrix phage A9 TaxID=857312 RepID=D9J0H4_9CAUD|nr:gp27 [Brochothrix phage A9]ADJ53069.1 gp27 [Brochothrix phage A9]